jgi:hypothetical protein
MNDTPGIEEALQERLSEIVNKDLSKRQVEKIVELFAPDKGDTITDEEIEKLANVANDYVDRGNNYAFNDGFVCGYKANPLHRVVDEKSAEDSQKESSVSEDEGLAQVQVDYYEDKIEMLNRILIERDNEINELKAVPISEDVEKAADDFLNYYNGAPSEKELFKAGAEWQKQQDNSAIGFAEWAYDNNWIIQPNKCWWNFHAEIEQQVEISTKELYNIYLKSKGLAPVEDNNAIQKAIEFVDKRINYYKLSVSDNNYFEYCIIVLDSVKQYLKSINTK